jgi:transposase
MGAHLNMTQVYARAVGGQRIAMPKPFIRGAKLSVIGAISSTKVEAALYGEWATNGDIFYHFIEHCLLPQLKVNSIVLLDNVGFHKSEKVINAIESTGAKVDFIPPYSPEVNPIEMMWSLLKNIIRQLEPRTIAQFQSAIKKAFEAVNQKKLQA